VESIKSKKCFVVSHGFSVLEGFLEQALAQSFFTQAKCDFVVLL
jgi:hypothetical protein